MTEAVRWGVLGAARFAQDQMARAIHAAEGADLAALATRDPARAEGFRAFAPRLRVHAGYDALLADQEVEAVYIPLPNHLHVEWTCRALAAGKAVLCEKPMAMAEGDFDRLIAARDAAGLPCAEAFMIVHHPQWDRLREMLGAGEIGALRQVDGRFTYDNRHDPENIRNRLETGGGALRDVGVYPIGATRHALRAEPGAVRASIVRENGVDATTRFSAEFDGVRLDALVSTRMMRWQEMTFHGETGLIRLSAPFNPRVAGEATVTLHRAAGPSTVERFPREDQYVRQVEAFGAALRHGTPFPWTLERARGTQAVIDRIFAAAG